MPHCSAAVSRNFCCSGCSFSPCAMPSMVPISWPSASAASIRQEQTRRSSSVMLQAPQSPEAQPSLEPVRPSGPRKRVEHGVVGLAEKFRRLAVDGGGDVNLGHGLNSLPRALGGDRGGALQQHAGDLGAVDNGAALVVDRAAGGAAGGARLLPARRRRACEPISAFAAGSTSSTVGATAPSPTRAAVQTPSFKVRLTPHADHGDVHLGARDHAQISVARTRRPRRQREADQDLAGLEIGAAGTGRHLLDRHLAAAVRPLHRDDGAGRDHRGHAVAGRRAVAQVAARGGAALHLLGADQIDGLQHAGPDFAEARMFGQRHARDGGADAEAAIGGFLDRGHLGDLLDVDDQARAAPCRSASAPEDRCRPPGCARHCLPRQMPRSLHQASAAPGIGFRSWSFLPSPLCVLLCALRAFLAHLISGCSDWELTRRKTIGIASGCSLSAAAPCVERLALRRLIKQGDL